MKIEAVGNYRGYIASWAFEQSASGLPFVRIGIKAQQEYRDEDWHELPGEMDIEQRAFLTTKEGKPNKVAIDQLKNACGFDPQDGARALTEGDRYIDTLVSFSTKAREYNGNTYYEVAYLNSWDKVPGGGGEPVSEAKIVELDSLLMGCSDGSPVPTPKKRGAAPF